MELVKSIEFQNRIVWIFRRFLFPLLQMHLLMNEISWNPVSSRAFMYNYDADNNPLISEGFLRDADNPMLDGCGSDSIQCIMIECNWYECHSLFNTVSAVCEDLFSLCGWERFILSPEREKWVGFPIFFGKEEEERKWAILAVRNISRHRRAFWRGGVDVYFVLFLLPLGRNCIFNCDRVAKNSGGAEGASG